MALPTANIFAALDKKKAKKKAPSSKDESKKKTSETKESDVQELEKAIFSQTNIVSNWASDDEEESDDFTTVPRTGKRKPVRPCCPVHRLRNINACRRSAPNLATAVYAQNIAAPPTNGVDDSVEATEEASEDVSAAGEHCAGAAATNFPGALPIPTRADPVAPAAPHSTWLHHAILGVLF